MKRILYLGLFISFNLFGAPNCPQGGVMTMNGDSGYRDNCEFYLDIYRMEKLAGSKECHSSLVPPTKPTDFTSCSGYVGRYFSSGVKASPESFKEKLQQTLKLGGEKSLVTITDHGNKSPLEDCENYEFDCVVRKFERQSNFTVGDGSINETELRTMLKEVREKQKTEMCPAGGSECKIPPLIMNFDHCYSGGMHNAFFDEAGVPLENACGISASSEDEFSYTGENIAKAINELSFGVQGPYRDHYRGFDINKDGHFSLSEVFDYLNLKTKKSVPLKTSDKFLLDHFKKNELLLNQNTCQLSSEDSVESLSTQLGEVSYFSEMEEFQKTAKKFLGQESIDDVLLETLIKKEEDARTIMLRDSDQDLFLNKMLDEALEKISLNGYESVTKLEKVRDQLVDQETALKEEFCLKDEHCNGLKIKSKELEDKILQENDPEKENLLFDEASKISKELRAYQKRVFLEEGCSGSCPQIPQKHLEVQGIASQISAAKEDLLQNHSAELIEKNKTEVLTFFQKLDEFVRPYGNPEVNSFLLKEKKRMEDPSFLLQPDFNDFHQPLYDLNSQLKDKLSLNQASSYQKFIKSRKALNQLKMSASLKDLFQKGDAEKLKHYESIKKCEETSLLSYKR
jgi:hypothetical protein